MPFVAAYFNELDSSSTLTSPSCHSARRACPELQNPQFQKTKDNLLPGEKVPVSERMRSGGKCSSQALTHHLRRSPPLTEGKDYLLDDGFCDFAFGSAQNDNIAGGVQVSYLNEGRVQSCSCGADSTHLMLPNATPQANRG